MTRLAIAVGVLFLTVPLTAEAAETAFGTPESLAASTPPQQLAQATEEAQPEAANEEQAEAEAEDAPEAAPPPPGPTREQVARAQAALAKLGYKPGPVDGILGRGTLSAVREFQENRDLEVTGVIDDAVLARMEEEAENAAEATTEQAEAAEAPEEPASPVEISEDPSSYDLGDLSDLNTFD